VKKYPFGKSAKKKLKKPDEQSSKNKTSRSTIASSIAAQKAQEMQTLLDKEGQEKWDRVVNKEKLDRYEMM